MLDQVYGELAQRLVTEEHARHDLGAQQRGDSLCKLHEEHGVEAERGQMLIDIDALARDAQLLADELLQLPERSLVGFQPLQLRSPRLLQYLRRVRRLFIQRCQRIGSGRYADLRSRRHLGADLSPTVIEPITLLCERIRGECEEPRRHRTVCRTLRVQTRPVDREPARPHFQELAVVAFAHPQIQQSVALLV